MSWATKKTEFNNRFDTLNTTYNIDEITDKFNSAVAKYINKGGVSKVSDSDSDYNEIIRLSEKAEMIKTKYSTLNKDILEFLKTQSEDADASNILKENGTLQQTLHRLQKVQTELKTDVENAIERDKLLRSRNTDVSSHKLFLLDRPVRRGMIPYLWIFGILFIGVGVIIFKMMFPTVNNDFQNVFAMIYDLFSNNTLIIALLVAILTVIIFVSLQLAGVF